MDAKTAGILTALLILASMTKPIRTLAATQEKDGIFIKFKKGVSEARINEVFDQYQLEVMERYSLIENLYLCRVPAQETTGELIRLLNQNPDVEYAEMNQEVEALDLKP